MKTFKKHSDGGAVKMKKTIVALTVIAVLGFAGMALAHGSGYGYGGHMMGYGGGHMGYGSGYGGHMGYGPGYSDESKEFLEKTADLRKKMHSKRFEYSEALRAGDEKKAEKLARELDELGEKIHKDAPRSFKRGYGRGCW
jgi:hypothetical protein